MFKNIANALNLPFSALLETTLSDIGINDVSVSISFVEVDGYHRNENGVVVRNVAPALNFDVSFMEPVEIDGQTSPLHRVGTVVSDHTNKANLADKYATDFRVAACQLRRIKRATVGDVAALIDAVARAVENAGSRYDKTVTNVGYSVIRAAAQR
ncbi:MAG: hypothetical protein IKY61_02295 [Thermoguttaceae bacterium]|nr:hypothetical protein [Thermoguttaceae bacterium]